MAAQKLATEIKAAAAVHAKIDEKESEEFKKVNPSNPPTQFVQTAQSVHPEKKHVEGWRGQAPKQRGLDNTKWAACQKEAPKQRGLENTK